MANLLRATNLRGYKTLVRQLGGDPEPLLARFHIPPALDSDPDAFFPFRSLGLLLEASATELDCPDFGMRLSRWQGLDILGPIAVIARNADTVLNAFKAIARFLHIHSPALKLSQRGPRGADALCFDFRIIESGLPLQAQGYELSLANGKQILELLGGAGAHPQEVAFMHRRCAPLPAYRQTFGCPVLFEQDWCGVRVSPALAARRIDAADPQTLQLATNYLESEHAPGAVSLATRVSELIQRLLPTGECRIETVAAQLAMHPRSLQRHLADENEGYEALLDAARRDLAARYLRESGLHLSQVSGLLGYAEQSSFNRACRRWFGMTPRRYRAQFNAGSA